MIIGAGMFSFLIGNICQILSNLNVETLEFQYKMDCVNRFMSKYKISNQLRVRANDFCFHVQQSELSLSESMKGSIKHFLSDPIMKEICLEIHGDVLRKIQFFRRAESEDFLGEVALKLQHNTRLFGPNEFIFEQGETVDEMFILYSGRVQMEDWMSGKVDTTRVLSGPAVIGENFILFDDPAMESAHTMSFCETAILVREDFVRTLERFPSCIEKVRVLTVQRLWKQFFHRVITTPKEEIEYIMNEFHPEGESPVVSPVRRSTPRKRASAVLSRSRSGFFSDDKKVDTNQKVVEMQNNIALIKAQQDSVVDELGQLNSKLSALLENQVIAV